MASMSGHGLNIAIHLDCADLSAMIAAYRQQAVDGFTTNPTLMAKACVPDYQAFAHQVLQAIPDLPVSFEVFADELPEMARQARTIASWGGNIFVKIPICNTRGESCIPLIRELSQEGLKLNVTAVMTLDQVGAVSEAVSPEAAAIASVFAGRIADTGRDPVPVIREAVAICEARRGRLSVLWASPREVLNAFQAEECGCHIITMTPDLLAKLDLRDKDLEEFSRETVQMFHDDALRAGYGV